MLTRVLLSLLLCSAALAYLLPVRRVLQGAMPNPQDAPAMARYIVHNSDWTVISHISQDGNTTGYPFGRVFSVSDGPIGKSSGTPYFYNSDLDPSVVALRKDSRCTLTMSLAQGEFCSGHNLDPENPLCGQVMITGNFEFLNENSEDLAFAKEALFSRHKEMTTWPADHGFQFGKVVVTNIRVVSFFGGSKYPTVAEYYAATPSE